LTFLRIGWKNEIGYTAFRRTVVITGKRGKHLYMNKTDSMRLAVTAVAIVLFLSACCHTPENEASEAFREIDGKLPL
jgi:hypothetical protein